MITKLEKAAESQVEILGWANDGTAESNDIKKAFKAGAEWQLSQQVSDEEIQELAREKFPLVVEDFGLERDSLIAYNSMMQKKQYGFYHGFKAALLYKQSKPMKKELYEIQPGKKADPG